VIISPRTKRVNGCHQLEIFCALKHITPATIGRLPKHVRVRNVKQRKPTNKRGLIFRKEILKKDHVLLTSGIEPAWVSLRQMRLLIGKIRGIDISLPPLLIFDFVDIACHQLDRILLAFNAQGSSGCGVCPSQYLLPIFVAHGAPCKANEGLSVVSCPKNFDCIVSFI